MSKYLTSTMRVLPAVQARQITDMLNSLRAKGTVRDINEYEETLKSLTSLVNADSPKPMFTPIRSLVWQLCSSDAHNTMMQAAKNDIEALFSQADDIATRLDDQHFFMMKSMMAELEHVIDEQQDTIRRLQILASSDNEFSKISVNSFRQTSLKSIDRSILGSESLFFDNRTGNPVGEDDIPSAVVSEQGQKLILPVTNEPQILPVSVRLLTDSESCGTDIDSSMNNDLSNIIDGTIGTFWSRTVYLSSSVERISTVLEFDLGAGRDINYCIVESATREPCFISEMWGMAPDGRRINLMLRRTNLSADSTIAGSTEGLLDEIEIYGQNRIDFEQVHVSRIRIKFTYSSFENTDFYYNSSILSSKMIDTQVSKNDLGPNDISSLAREVLVSDNLANICNVPETTTTHINKICYFFSLDNVYFGNSLYTDTGIFVSEPISVSNPGVISIKTSERNVGVTRIGIDEDLAQGEDGILSNAGSVEYEVIKRSLLKNGSYKQEHFSIPFLGQTRVIRERLLLTIRIDNTTLNDTGYLRFTPIVTDDPPACLQVYCNNELIFLGDASDGYKVAYTIDSNEDLVFTSSPMINPWNVLSNWTTPSYKLWIKINNPSANNIYTVDYDIKASKPNEIVYVDNNKTIFMGDAGRLEFRPTILNEDTESCNLYLQITLRRNSPYHSLSPEVHEYALLIAPYN